jgi:hypothetical protein
MGYDDYVGDSGAGDPYAEKDRPSGLPIFVLLGVVGLIVVGAGLVLVRFANADPIVNSMNETRAIGALKTISMAQTLYREGDKDRDGTLDYAPDLQILGRTQLIDPLLGSGTKDGYVFETHNGPAVEFQWFATADPLEPGRSGLRFFYIDQSGVIYYSLDGPIQGPVDFNKMPPGVKVLGQ